MKKAKKKIYSIELLLVVILLIGTLFSLIDNKIIFSIGLLVTTIILSLLFKRKRILKPNNKKIIWVSIIFAVIYIALYYTLGIYVGFHQATIKFSLKTLIQYIIPITIIIITSELIRDRLLTDTSRSSKLLIITIGTLIDVAVYQNIYNLRTITGFFSFVGIVVVTAVVNNLLYTYMSEKYGYKPVIIYKLIMMLYQYIIPITPNVYTYFRVFMRMIYPLIIYLYLDKYYDLDQFKENKKEGIVQTVVTGVIFVVEVIIIALISCQFSIGILVIGSGSMSGSVEIGDAVLYRKTNKNLKTDDIIVYKKDKIKVVHRITAIKVINNEIRYYTKGDANELMDEDYVTEKTLIGKVVLKIKYIGRPTLWIRNIFE